MEGGREGGRERGREGEKERERKRKREKEREKSGRGEQQYYILLLLFTYYLHRYYDKILDSVVSDKINYDLVDFIANLGAGTVTCPELLGWFSQPASGHGTPRCCSPTL